MTNLPRLCLAFFLSCLVGTAATIHSSYGQLPIRFEKNQDGFLARGSGYGISLGGRGEMSIALLRKGNATQLRIAPENASATRVETLAQLPGHSNYLTGNDPRRWRTSVPAYSGVRYAGIYRGIDLLYYGTQKQLEFDFVVQPGADPRQIALRVEGARRISISADGDLELRTGSDSIRFQRPVAYQQIDGAKRPVTAAYKLDRGRVRFRIGEYDRAQPLVIDPVLAYSTFIGGLGPDASLAIRTDAAGNAYLTGFTLSPNFPTTSGAFDRFCGSDGLCSLSLDAIVTKVNPAGDAIVFSTFLGGNNNDYGYGIDLDSTGVYVSGYTESTNFPLINPFQGANAGGMDLFAAKLSPDGARLLYSTYVGGSAAEVSFASSVAANGNIYITGYTESPNFPVSAGAFDRTCGSDGNCNAGQRDALLTVLNTNASGAASLVYSTFLGGSLQDEGRGTAVDAGGQAYVLGFTVSQDFPTSAGAYDRTCGVDGACNGGFRDVFLTRIAPATAGAASLVASTYLGGAGTEVARSMDFDREGNIVVTGSAGTADFPVTANAAQPVYGGNPEDGFISKLDASLARLIYSTYVGGNDEDVSHGVAVDAGGSIYVAGYTKSANMAVRNAIQPALAGDYDAFIAKYSAAGALIYLTYLGGPQRDRGYEVAVDASGAAYVVGHTESSNFPTQRPLQDYGGTADIFLAKIVDGPVVNAGGIVNGASYTAALAPGIIASIFGSGFAAAPATATSVPLPVELGGVSVRVNNIPAPLFFVSPTQINFQVPWEMEGITQASVTVTANGMTSAATTVTLSPFAPGIFSMNASGQGQGAVLIANTSTVAGPQSPVQRGGFVSIYATGLGAVRSQPATGAAATSAASTTIAAPAVTIGGVAAEVTFSGLAPGFVGLYQVNARVPANAPAGASVPLQISIGGVASNTVTIAVQ